MPFSSAILSFLASVALRSLAIFGAAALVLTVLRVRSAAARHAAWTAVLLGMLLLPVLEPVLPPLPIRVLKPAPVAAVALPELPAVAVPTAPTQPRPASHAQYTWRDAAAALYALVALILLARLAVSYLFTRRLLRAAQPIEVATPNRDREGADGPRGATRRRDSGLYESSWISVPMTAGRVILLPPDWRTWPSAKLDAVLAHERTHILRADWAISLASGINRSVFWFHPLAWWLERRLAALAEHACDDAALLEVPPAPYAQALLDMAAAVRTAQGRLMWEAMAMAKAAEVQKRIERALDETREIPRPFTARRWMALAVCAVPVLWLAAVAQLAPATAQEQPKAAAPAGDAAAAERAVAANPNDLDERVRLILSYYSANVREPRLAQIYWMISNHPEAAQTLFVSRGLTPKDSAYNSAADYQRALGLWRQAADQAASPIVVRNAAEFIGTAGDPAEVERMILEGRKRFPDSPLWTPALGKLYATAVLGSMGDPAFPNSNPSFALHARTELDNSDDRTMLMVAAATLTTVARHVDGVPLPAGTLNLDEHPALVPAVEYGRTLLARMRQTAGVVGGVVGGVPSGVAGGEPRGVLGGIIGSVPSAVAQDPASLPPAPPVLNNIQPTYPPLAIQARISGVIRCKVTIGTDGTVRSIRILSGHPLLVSAAMEALKEWKFQPPAVQGDYRVEIPFTLADLSPAAVAAAGELPADHQGKKAAGTSPKVIVIGANVQASKLVNHVDPVYPWDARVAGIQGTVTLKVTIDENGSVVRMEATDGNPVLADAAFQAVRQWTYQPTLLNGDPVKVITTVVVPFHL
jgi:TonB family protein